MSDNENNDDLIGFQDLPYDALLTIFLYCTGVKTIAALQGTAKRLYEIGSEEDLIWKNQVSAFHPQLLQHQDPFFVGYYFLLRNCLSSKKVAAMTTLVNSVAEGVSLNNNIVMTDEMRTLATTSEINLSKGVCLGGKAGLIFRQMGQPFSMLDSLNLNGQHLRAEGLEFLADAAKLNKLPFLKTLGLRQNKLGSGVAAEKSRAGAALAKLLDQCPALMSLDLSENGIIGEGGIKSILPSEIISHNRALPQRLVLNKNPLGATGVTALLSLYKESLRKIYDAFLAAPKTISISNRIPLLVALQNVGLGFTYKSDDASSVRDPKRASIEECLALMESIHDYSKVLLQNAEVVSLQRKDQRQRQKRRGGHSNQQNNNTMTNSSAQMSSAQSRQNDGIVFFESLFLLNDVQDSNVDNVDTNDEYKQVDNDTAAALMSNALSNQLRDEVPDKKPEVAKGLGMRMSQIDTRYPKGSPGYHGPKNRKARCRDEMASDDESACLKFGWPKFTGGDPSSGCVIC